MRSLNHDSGLKSMGLEPRIKKAELAQGRLLFVTEAFRALRSDENFLTLLRAESLEAMPTYLEHNARAVP